MRLHAHPGACQDCHRIDDEDYALLAPLPELCSRSGCHAELASGKPHLHGPFALGDCRACHLPHSSAASGLLTWPRTRLCLSCHPSGALRTCPSAADPERSECSACHDAHGGVDALFRIASDDAAAHPARPRSAQR